jgi:group I intron endonuclease
MHVYCITNTVNGKIYVGQHSGENLEKYFRSQKKYHKKCRALYGAFKKYGLESFKIDSLVRPADQQQMDELEKFFIRTLESQNPKIGYNIAPGGYAGVGSGWTHSPEARKKMSLAGKGKKKSAQARQNMSEGCKGRKNPGLALRNTGQLRPHLAALNKSRKGVPLSDAHRAAIAEGTRKGLQKSRIVGI